jgi:hypothetical protein
LLASMSIACNHLLPTNLLPLATGGGSGRSNALFEGESLTAVVEATDESWVVDDSAVGLVHCRRWTK